MSSDEPTVRQVILEGLMKKNLLLRELSRYEIGTYADIIYRNALLHGDEEAFKCGEERVSFSQFNGRVNRLIAALHAVGIKKGDVLGVLSWNCLEYLDVYGAAMKGGFIISPFNPRLKTDELEYVVNYSESRVLFVGPQLLETTLSLQGRVPSVERFVSFGDGPQEMIVYREWTDTWEGRESDIHLEEDDPVFLFYTSGTTGVPRGAVYTHRRSMDDTRRFATALSLECGDRQVQVMPLFHVGGAKNLWGYFFVAGSNVIMRQTSFDPTATLQALQDERATDIHIVPKHLAAFLALPDVDSFDLSALKRMFYAASPMPVELLRRGMEKWGPVFIQFYGATEDGPNVLCLSKRQHDVLHKSPEEQKVLASAGFPHIGVHVRIVDEKGNDSAPGEVGEIIVRSKATMLEYWRRPEETRDTVVNGWVHTGDLGRYDEKGHIYIVDRKKDMIITGGENVFPREVEETLHQHPDVLEAAVIGISDPYWVEKVHAVVVLKDGSRSTDQDLIGFCKQRLAGYKAPKAVEIVDCLPKNPSGKDSEKRDQSKVLGRKEQEHITGREKPIKKMNVNDG
jgi:long-chain acyl-CoA synthetase